MCSNCQREKIKTKANEPFEPIRTAIKLRQIVAYDVVTLPWGEGQNRYFLFMTDLFSKFVEIASMHDQTSSTILEALSMFGSISMDPGSNPERPRFKYGWY